MSYTVKNVKSFKGMEGYGYNADLHLKVTSEGVIADLVKGGEVAATSCEFLDDIVEGCR
jgi:hypothetical protein